MDLARALAAEPDVLLLDEMTAALPADLTERVLDVLRRQRETGRSVVFISHRLLEVSSLCDRATVLRDGETVGVVDMAAGAEERIVELMLPPTDRRRSRRAAPTETIAGAAPTAVVDTERRPPAPGQRRSASERVSTTSPSSSTRARSWAWWRSRARARISCSRCWPASAVLTPASCSSMAREVRLRPSGGCHPGRPRVRAREPDRRPAHAAIGAGERRPALLGASSSLGPHRRRRRAASGWVRRSSACRSTPAPNPRCAGSPVATSRR